MKKGYKSLIAMLMAIVMCLAFTACGSSSEPAEEDNATVAEALGEHNFVASSEGEAVDGYFTIPASRDENVRIPVGVTMPEVAEGEKAPVVVLVHGFLGSKDEEFGFFANDTDEQYDYDSIAAALLEKGIGTIRVDQAGSGESTDDFTNYTPENSVSDIQDAYDYCMANFPFDAEKVGLVGWSMGGKVGPAFASKNTNISTMVLLNPAGDNGATSLETAAGCGLDLPLLQSKMEDGKVLNEVASGFVGKDIYMSQDFITQVEESKTGDEVKAFLEAGNKGLLLYGDKDSIINPETYKWLMDNTTIDTYCIEGMDHDLGLESARPDFTQKVVAKTVEYCAENLTK